MVEHVGHLAWLCLFPRAPVPYHVQPYASIIESKKDGFAVGDIMKVGPNAFQKIRQDVGVMF